MKNNALYPVAPFVYSDIELSETVLIDGIPHITRKAVGEFLEYSDPQKAVDKMLERNLYIEEYSVPVRLTGTDGKNYQTFVYDPMGFLLIVMESSQPKAQAMKISIAKFVHHYAFCPEEITFKQQLELKKYRRTLLNDLEKCYDKFTQQGLLAELADIDSYLGRASIDIKLLGKKPDQTDLEDLN
ncbi:hypothetical protein [Methylobacter sp. S3L5C]|uniref:hypothetical protein n=1 Tax=Methylobacter sp. S3L5C TaxID=2839024 RepID=UPI001FABC09F|nr:hypothetical protein [Methylobacter sp. S3L5C]UOA08584.1 hypothetical protein KKZ03_20735 [Methylobacter sp. S3L5C]